MRGKQGWEPASAPDRVLLQPFVLEACQSNSLVSCRSDTVTERSLVHGL